LIVVLGEETTLALLWPPQIPHILFMELTAGVANPHYGNSP